jgi:TRAP-type uncharacterized transport system substrate-binding protein
VTLSHSKIAATRWRDYTQIWVPLLVLSIAAVWLTVHFVPPAPPHVLTMSAGPKGSAFETVAMRYQKILARSDINLKIISSEGSLENLSRLTDKSSGTDVALVQSGVAASDDVSDLVSLGSVFYQPLTIFYRGAKPLTRLSELRSERIAIGSEGSGTRSLALALLGANGIDLNGPTQLVDLEGEAASAALLHNQVDAIFLAGDSASPDTIRKMAYESDIHLFKFSQLDAYLRRFPYLNELLLPEGAFDLGENLPSSDITLLAPTVELVAHTSLHPALCDLLIEAATEVHGGASFLQAAGVFPTPLMHSFPVSSEAARYYKSGNRSFSYRYLPFWLASLLDRTLVILVPIVVVIIPGLHYLPQLYYWRIARRIHRRYEELMAVEREAGDLSEDRRAALLARLDDIERSVISGQMPGSHAEKLYFLREYIGLVRATLSVPAASRD